ncbi:MAG TPA: methyltransferase domain-containing protein [Methylovirgula sp.]|nr:methyltransferase domain-containing protein [Methylovirgula sp.]
MQIELPAASEIDAALAGWRAANSSLNRMFDQHPAPHEALRRFGLTLWAKGHIETAIGVLKAAIALAPEETALWNDLAGAFYASARLEEARAAQHISLEKDPAQPQAWLLLATLDNGAGSLTAAERGYLTALKLDPHLPDASFGLGVIYFQQRRFADAVTQLRKSIADGGHNMGLYVCLGQALFLQGDFSGAVSALSVAASFTPSDGKVIEKFAKLRLIETAVRGSADEAIAVYREVAGPYAEDIDAVTAPAFHFLSGFGYRDAAIRLGRARLAHKPADAIQRYLLAALEGARVARAPDDYLLAYFDGFAETFEAKLVGALGYRVPEHLHALLAASGRRFANMLDLGCGTGLAGPLLREFGGRLTGVDLSSRMLEKAAARELYDRLVESEVGRFLAQTKETFDLVLAADLFVYFGDLTGLLGEIARAMQQDGLLAFNVETTRADFAVLPSGRFAHAVAYIEAVSRSDFDILEIRETMIRLEANKPVAGVLVILQRR